MNLDNPLEMSQVGLENWWAEFVDYYHGWYYLTEASPKLLTTYYAELVANGTILASKENILSAQRHLRDLKRENDDDFAWRFDEDKAWRPIRFIESKTKPSKGNFNKMVLQPFQHFIIGSLFGWVHKKTGVRRFTEGTIFMSRKNGKTPLQAGLAAYMAGFDGENGAEVYALANSQKQSRLLFEETTNMIKASPYLSEKFTVRRSDIFHKKSNSTIQALSAERSNKDGYNTHFAVFDEIHEYKTYDLIEVMRRSMGAREQPLTIYISTAGYVLDGPMTDFFREGQETLTNYEDGLNERSFYYLAKVDNISEIEDPDQWIKANPNLPMMSGVKLLSDFKKDRRNPAQRSDWITKQFNLFSESGAQSFLDAEIILSNDEVIDEQDLQGIHPVAGFDLSDTEDFTAAALVFPLQSGKIYIKQQTWIPQARYDREEQYKSRFDEWIEAGEMIVLPGAYVDHGYVYDWLVEMDQKYGVVQINYDRAKAINLNSMLEEYGVKMEVTRQGFTTLGGPLQNFKELMLDHKVVFNNSRIFKWYLSNVALVTDRNNNWMPTKVSRYRKIDGFAAMLNAHVTVAPQLAKLNTEKDSTVEFLSFDDIMNGNF